MNNTTFNQDEFLNNAKKHQHWTRLVYMLIFGLLLNLAGALLWMLSIAQFVFVLITGEDNLHLRRFGRAAATFVRDALLFVTFNTERKPFPFSDWPSDSEEPASRTSHADATGEWIPGDDNTAK